MPAVNPPQGNPIRRLYLLNAPIGAGKTTWCLKFAQEAKAQGRSVSGLCSPAVFVEGQKIGIDLLDLRSSARRRLAILKPASSRGLTTRRWLFDEAAVAWGNDLLRQELALPGDLFILDELGPLELERSQGLTEALPILDARQHRLAVVVVRPSLVPVAQARWPWAVPLDLAQAAEKIHASS
jgi:nucleoside-triphosphatase THEP1